MRRALVVTLVVLVSSACGAGDSEQRSEGTDACIADLAQAIGPNPELRGATWSPDGRRIAFSAGNGRKTGIYAVTVADCTVERLGPDADLIAGTADWSSMNVLAFDGKARGRTEEGIYTMTEDGGHPRRVTEGPDLFPEWSPDGRFIAAAVMRDGVWNVASIDTVTGRERLLTGHTTPRVYVRYPDWARTGSRIVFEEAEVTGNIWVSRLGEPAGSLAGIW